MNFDEFYDALCEETRKSPNDAIGLSVKYYCHLAFQAGAASRDAEIAELVTDAARYRHLRQDENFCVDEKSGGQWEPVHYEQLDAALDAALAKVRKP